MTPVMLKWTSSNGNYRVFVQAEPWAEIARTCAKAGSVETGGILIGYYSQDRSTAVVTQATSPPKDSKCSPTCFLRGSAGLERLLAGLWKGPDRRYYLGEWHYHPARSVEPSRRDLIQMRQISESVDYRCVEPVLLIVGEGKGLDLPARVFVFPSGLSMLLLWVKSVISD